ncbi:hypothetical protein N7471_008856, partial [Penicillium samsonianum]|uniref:uncharacterized protein n=1 Tax=Penicillium samsonianum TaxID=1882272 RepID=UPI00254808DC
IRYGVVANIAVSHTAAGGSIPPIGLALKGTYVPISSNLGLTAFNIVIGELQSGPLNIPKDPWM